MSKEKGPNKVYRNKLKPTCEHSESELSYITEYHNEKLVRHLQVFQSLERFHDYLYENAIKWHFYYVCTDSEVLKTSDGNNICYTYHCANQHKVGVKRSEADCPCMIQLLSVPKFNRFIVKRLCNHHNHPISADVFLKLPHALYLPVHVQDEILDLEYLGLNSTLLEEYMTSVTGRPIQMEHLEHCSNQERVLTDERFCYILGKINDIHRKCKNSENTDLDVTTNESSDSEKIIEGTNWVISDSSKTPSASKQLLAHKEPLKHKSIETPVVLVSSKQITIRSNFANVLPKHTDEENCNYSKEPNVEDNNNKQQAVAKLSGEYKTKCDQKTAHKHKAKESILVHPLEKDDIIIIVTDDVELLKSSLPKLGNTETSNTVEGNVDNVVQSNKVVEDPGGTKNVADPSQSHGKTERNTYSLPLKPGHTETSNTVEGNIDNVVQSNKAVEDPGSTKNVADASQSHDKTETNNYRSKFLRPIYDDPCNHTGRTDLILHQDENLVKFGDKFGNIEIFKEYVIRNAKRFNFYYVLCQSDGRVNAYEYICYNKQTCTSKAVGLRQRQAVKTNCPCRIRLRKVGKEDALTVVKVCHHHDHPLTEENFLKMQHGRRFPNELKQEVIDLMSLNVETELARRYVMSKTGFNMSSKYFIQMKNKSKGLSSERFTEDRLKKLHEKINSLRETYGHVIKTKRNSLSNAKKSSMQKENNNPKKGNCERPNVKKRPHSIDTKVSKRKKSRQDTSQEDIGSNEETVNSVIHLQESLGITAETNSYAPYIPEQTYSALVTHQDDFQEIIDGDYIGETIVYSTHDPNINDYSDNDNTDHDNTDQYDAYQTEIENFPEPEKSPKLKNCQGHSNNDLNETDNENNEDLLENGNYTNYYNIDTAAYTEVHENETTPNNHTHDEHDTCVACEDTQHQIIYTYSSSKDREKVPSYNIKDGTTARPYQSNQHINRHASKNEKQVVNHNDTHILGDVSSKQSRRIYLNKFNIHKLIIKPTIPNYIEDIACEENTSVIDILLRIYKGKAGISIDKTDPDHIKLRLLDGLPNIVNSDRQADSDKGKYEQNASKYFNMMLKFKEMLFDKSKELMDLKDSSDEGCSEECEKLKNEITLLTTKCHEHEQFNKRLIETNVKLIKKNTEFITSKENMELLKTRLSMDDIQEKYDKLKKEFTLLTTTSQEQQMLIKRLTHNNIKLMGQTSELKKTTQSKELPKTRLGLIAGLLKKFKKLKEENVWLKMSLKWILRENNELRKLFSTTTVNNTLSEGRAEIFRENIELRMQNLMLKAINCKRMVEQQSEHLGDEKSEIKIQNDLNETTIINTLYELHDARKEILSEMDLEVKIKNIVSNIASSNSTKLESIMQNNDGYNLKRLKLINYELTKLINEYSTFLNSYKNKTSISFDVIDIDDGNINVVNQPEMEMDDVVDEPEMEMDDVVDEPEMEMDDVVDEPELEMSDVVDEPELEMSDVVDEFEMEMSDVLNEPEIEINDGSAVHTSHSDKDPLQFENDDTATETAESSFESESE